jgi:hypothetical protein
MEAKFAVFFGSLRSQILANDRPVLIVHKRNVVPATFTAFEMVDYNVERDRSCPKPALPKRHAGRLESAAALLIRSWKDLLERLRDHAVAGGVRMEIEDRAHPRPLADALHVERNAVHERPVCRREGGFDVCNRY